MKMIYYFLLWLSLLPCFAQLRTWTLADGRALQGEYLDSVREHVVILSGGKERRVKWELLSEADRDYARGYFVSRSQPDCVLHKHNFNDAWPSNSTLDDQIKVKLVSEQTGEFVYETAHFRFYCPVKLSLDTMRIIGRVFEGTYTANKLLPLNFPCRQFEACSEIDESRKGSKAVQEEKFIARFFETRELYLKHIAQWGSHFNETAGYFDGREVLLPLESLGIVKKGKSYALESKAAADIGVLIHEITHQMTLYSAGGRMNKGRPMSLSAQEYVEFENTGAIPRRLERREGFSPAQVPVWLSEGVAEFFRMAPYRNGRFTLSRLDGQVKSMIVGGVRGSRQLGRKIEAPRLQLFMEQSKSEFQRAVVNDAQLCYGYAALVFYYFAALDGKGDAARLKHWMMGYQTGQYGPMDYQRLLDGRSWQELEADFAKSMKSKLGITMIWK